MFKYFEIDSESTVGSLKKQFKTRCKELHPDFNGGCKVKEKEFKEMLNEYEAALKYIGEQKGKEYKFDAEYADLIIELLKMEMVNVEIEICGWFIYLWGETKPYKENLKELEFRWNPKKVCWYWRPAWYRNKNKNSWSMDQIRDFYGSENVRQEKEEREMLTA